MKTHVISTHNIDSKYYNIDKKVLFDKNIRAIAKIKVNPDNTVNSIVTFKVDPRNVKKIVAGKTSRTMRVIPNKEKINTRFESISNDVRNYIEKKNFKL